MGGKASPKIYIWNAKNVCRKRSTQARPGQSTKTTGAVKLDNASTVNNPYNVLRPSWLITNVR